MDFNHYLKLQKSGDILNAEKGYKLLISQKKIQKDLFSNLGLIYLQTDRENDAKKLFIKELKINENSLVALNNLGVIFTKSKDYQAAKTYFLQASKIQENKNTFYFLGQVCSKLYEFDDAINYYKKSLKLEKKADTACNLGDLYYTQGKINNAKEYSELAIKLNPRHDLAYNNLGLVNIALGNIKDAKNNYETAIKINPDNLRAHFNLSKIVNYNEDKELLFLLNSMCKNKKEDQEKVFLYFALGKAYEDLQEYNKSFSFYKKGNFLKRKNIEYSHEYDKKLFKKIISVFKKDTIKKYYRPENKKNKPIFVLGMPRSGTSLVEQIIASHSEVHGAGEINYIDNIIKKYFTFEEKLFHSSTINKENFLAAGMEYMKKINKLSVEKKYVINKLPLNFRWIGLIKLMLPGSIVIHCTRNPMDTCLSIFQQNFLIKGNEYSFNLIETAKYYNLYKEIFKHWRKIFFNDFLEIKYEEIVMDQKNITKKMLDYCNLAWEDQCLEFYKTKRSVRTSSDHQVRQKLYSKSINRWEKYSSELKIIESMVNS